MASESGSTDHLRRRSASRSPGAAKRPPSSSPPALRSKDLVMSTSIVTIRLRRVARLALCLGAVGLFTTIAATQSPRFYSDDPIAREPESRDASKAAPYDKSEMYDLTYNLFVNAKKEPRGLRAK